MLGKLATLTNSCVSPYLPFQCWKKKWSFCVFAACKRRLHFLPTTRKRWSGVFHCDFEIDNMIRKWFEILVFSNRFYSGLGQYAKIYVMELVTVAEWSDTVLKHCVPTLAVSFFLFVRTFAYLFYVGKSLHITQPRCMSVFSLRTLQNKICPDTYTTTVVP